MAFKFPLSAQIAYRYLRSKKTYSAVNYISIVSICGVAIATMAIVCVLSVFNGFQDVLGSKLSQLSPDVKVSPAKGKVIDGVDSLVSVVEAMEGVELVMPTIIDNALAIHDRRQLPIRLKGVDADKYAQMSSIESIVKDDGQYLLTSYGDDQAEGVDEHGVSEGVSLADDSTGSVSDDDIAGDASLDDDMLFAYADELYGEELFEPQEQHHALISVGVAVSLKAHPSRTLSIFTPSRLGQVNMANPAASFLTDSLSIAGVFQSDHPDYDQDLVIVDMAMAKRLFQYDDQASAIEIKLGEGVDVTSFAQGLSERLGQEYVVEDRLQQEETNFRMINIEKWVTFLLLAFILLIASFNMISSMSMLIVEKIEGVKVLRNLGITESTVGNIFRWESCYVSLVGAVCGIVVGLVLCLLQQEFGLIKLNGAEGGLIIDAYPVKVLLSDIVVVLVPVLLIGWLTATISGYYAKSLLRR